MILLKLCPTARTSRGCMDRTFSSWLQYRRDRKWLRAFVLRKVVYGKVSVAWSAWRIRDRREVVFRRVMKAMALASADLCRHIFRAWAGYMIVALKTNTAVDRYSVWCGVVWCGVVWCGVVWCGVVWCGII